MQKQPLAVKEKRSQDYEVSSFSDTRFYGSAQLQGVQLGINYMIFHLKLFKGFISCFINLWNEPGS